MEDMRKKCLEVLEKGITISRDAEGYKRFSGEVYMAYRLGLISDDERFMWLARASEMAK